MDLAVTLDAREYKGNMQLTINIKDIKLSCMDMEKNIHMYRIYEKYRREEKLSGEEGNLLTPSRNELVCVYKTLVQNKKCRARIQSLSSKLRENISLAKFLVCLDVLKERELIKFELQKEILTYEICVMDSKVDIFKSSIFEKLKELTN